MIMPLSRTAEGTGCGDTVQFMQGGWIGMATRMKDQAWKGAMKRTKRIPYSSFYGIYNGRCLLETSRQHENVVDLTLHRSPGVL